MAEFTDAVGTLSEFEDFTAGVIRITENSAFIRMTENDKYIRVTEGYIIDEFTDATGVASLWTDA